MDINERILKAKKDGSDEGNYRWTRLITQNQSSHPFPWCNPNERWFYAKLRRIYRVLMKVFKTESRWMTSVGCLSMSQVLPEVHKSHQNSICAEFCWEVSSRRHSTNDFRWLFAHVSCSFAIKEFVPKFCLPLYNSTKNFLPQMHLIHEHNCRILTKILIYLQNILDLLATTNVKKSGDRSYVSVVVYWAWFYFQTWNNRFKIEVITILFEKKVRFQIHNHSRVHGVQLIFTLDPTNYQMDQLCLKTMKPVLLWIYRVA